MEKEQTVEGKPTENGREMVENFGRQSLVQRGWKESKKLWHIAGPAILTSVAQFSVGTVTVAFAGHLGTAELAAVTLVSNVIEGFVYGVMLGMGSALETLCGQAVGAGQLNMLGIYMQRSFIIAGITSLFLTPVFVFASPILKLLHQDKHISDLAGKFALYALPQLYSYALNFPIQKFLQAQSKIWVMTIITILGLGIHVILNLIFVTQLGLGLLGAAIAGNITWWIIVLAQLVYVISGFFPESWTGWSLSAFKSLTNFVKLSLASAIMLCLELWYYTAVILMVGWAKNPEIAVDAISICMNLQLWTLMVTMGFNAAVSVRVSNELGAGNPKAAKFSIVVTVITSIFFGIFFTAAILATRKVFPKIFTAKPEVIKETSKLGYFLAATIVLNSIQPVLHGVAIGAGWQFLVALVNIGCYYIFGLPLGALLGYKFGYGVRGIWSGVLAGCIIQTSILMIITWRANWRKEASQAEERVRTWGGGSEPQNQREAMKEDSD
ncbi:Multi antimicrobial extrusion protein [Dillenia turbinata]|uniref:Protein DETOXIFICATION n=1 Tax=Dillenia turbinata TaxID=194707 RepID=A0AAN8ZV13_9MAGN